MLSQISKRVNNPFLFATLASWPIINYRIVLALLSSEKFQDKINYISTAAYPAGTAWIYTLLLPFATAAFYTFAYPFIDIFIGSFSQWVENLKAKSILKISRKMPVDLDTHLSILLENEKRKEEFAEALQRRQNDYQSFKSESNARIKDLQERLFKQTLKIFNSGKNLSPRSSMPLIMQDAGSASELGDYNEMLHTFQVSPLAKELKKFSEFALTIPENDGTRFTDYMQIQEKVLNDANEGSADDLIELLLALQMVHQGSSQKSYSVETDFCRRIIEVYEKGK